MNEETLTDEAVGRQEIALWNEATEAGVEFTYMPHEPIISRLHVCYDNFNISDYKRHDEAIQEIKRLNDRIESSRPQLNVIAEYRYCLEKVAGLKRSYFFVEIPRIKELLKKCHDEIPKILNPHLP